MRRGFQSESGRPCRPIRRLASRPGPAFRGAPPDRRGAPRAAVPQATRVRSRGDASASCPTPEPTAEPICTIGPARPATPPKPIVSNAAIASTVATRLTIRPPRRTTAIITNGTAWPRASLATRLINGPASRPPITGSSTRWAEPSLARADATGPRANPAIWSTSRTKPAAPQPVSTPTTTARTTSQACRERNGMRAKPFVHRFDRRRALRRPTRPGANRNGTSRSRTRAGQPTRAGQRRERVNEASGRLRRAGHSARRPRWGGNRPSTSGPGGR